MALGTELHGVVLGRIDVIDAAGDRGRKHADGR
jgi:hypothetical protein